MAVKCEMCEETFSKRSYLNKHVSNNRFRCPGKKETVSYESATTMSSIPVMLDMPSLIESKLPKEEPEEIEPKEREENLTYDNCVLGPETGKLIKIIKTIQSVTPPIFDVPSLIESELPKEEPEEIEPEERDVNLLDGICVLGSGTGKLIEELKKNSDPEPITSPELHTNKKETQFSPQEKSSRFLFQCELCNLNFEHEQNFHVHKWVHEFKTVTGSNLLNDFDGLSNRSVMIDVPSLIESELPKEELEEMEPEEREENLTYDNHVLDPGTGKLIKIEEPEKSPEPECQPEPKLSVRPVMLDIIKVEDDIKPVADDPMVNYDPLNNDDNTLVCDICLIKFDSFIGLNNHSAQECENEFSWLLEKQEKWKSLSRDLYENLPEDFVSEFFSELPIIIDSGNSKAMKLSCDLCSMVFYSNESLNNHRIRFCKSEISSMRENKFLWKRLTIDLSINLPEDFFLNFISGLFVEASVRENNPTPEVKPNKESPSKKELNKSGEKYEKNNETTSKYVFTQVTFCREKIVTMVTFKTFLWFSFMYQCNMII